MTSRKFVRITFSALLILGVLAVIGCDERNEADLPPVIYSLKKNIVTPGVALYVDAKDDMLAVAASSAGTYVYNIANPSDPDEVFHYEQTGRLYTSHAAIDPINHLVVTASGPASEPGDKYPIHLYETGVRIGAAAISLPIEDFEVRSSTNVFSIWRTDATDGLAEDSYCFIPDSNRWRPDYCTDFYFGYNPNTYRLRGFGINGDIFAVAQANYEIRFHNIVTGEVIAQFSTPGDPQDCAWYGNYLLVADYVHFTVMNVTNIDTPTVAKTLTIPGADRLIRIVMDGNYAILLDDADGFYVVDVSTPSEPRLVQSFALPEPSGLTATNGKVIASDEQLGVLIYQR